MFFSAVIIERSSKEYYLEPNKPSTLYWLQPGDQNVGDQVFGAFLAEEEAPHLYIKSVRDRRFDGQNVKIYLTVLFTILGFIIQFIGLRGLHASVILASLGATFVMSVLRTCLRAERMAPDENKLKEDRETTAHKQQELDFFAFYLGEVKSFDMISPSSGDISPDDSSLEQTDDSDEILAKHLIQTRIRLAELTSGLDDGSAVAWDDMPTRRIAHNLARTIEATMDLMSSWGIDFGKLFHFPLAFECQSASSEGLTPSQVTYPIGTFRCGDALRWRVNPHELEAILGLWTWSLYKSDKKWRQPLSRLVGLNEAEAEKEETYLYFHKWIFRQTEAKMVSHQMMDSSRRLFGFESDIFSHERDILAVRTENDLQTMAAQDIYIRFLRSALGHLTELGGDIDVSVGLQGSYVAESSKVNELRGCFESCNLGSREDALLCIVPALKDKNLLPTLAAESINIRKRTERFIEGNDWAKAFQLVEWICQRSIGAEFEYSMYELGYLCRRALLANTKLVQLEGFNYTWKIIESENRTEFLQAQRMSLSSNWPQSLENQKWWHVFSQQLGWVAWHISRNVPGLEWMQSSLMNLDAQKDLGFSATTRHDTEETRVGERAMQEWLAMNHVDFEQGHTLDQDSLGYRWALKKEFHLLLYCVLVRWIELGAESSDLYQHAFTVSAICRSDWGIQVLQRRHVDIDILNSNTVSAMMEVVVHGDLGATQTLLTNGANPNGNDRVLDKRPLILAAHRGYTSIVELLLDHGATLEVSDSVGLSALYWATSENEVEIVRLLLSRGADANRGVDGSTALHSAITNNQPEIVELLLEHGADVNSAEGNLSHLPLIRAVSSFNADMVRLLLAKGADINVRDENGLNVLDWVRRNMCQDAAAILETALNSVL